jgi:hypothetical protein
MYPMRARFGSLPPTEDADGPRHVGRGNICLVATYCGAVTQPKQPET